MMKRTVGLALATTLLFLCRTTAAGELETAKPESVGMSSQALARVGTVMQRFVDDEKVAGAIAVVARRGKIVLYEAVGQADIDSGEPMRTDTIVRIYSMTKPITSVAVMLLVEDGKLSLDDSAAEFLPELADVKVFAGVDGGAQQVEEPQRPVTIRDLLRHTSGLTYGLFSNTPVDEQYVSEKVIDKRGTLADMITKLGDLPLLYQPGTRFNYSVSSDVLGRVVEVASGRSFDDFLRERIFEPLDMRDTSFFVPDDKLNRFAANHMSKLTGGQFVIDAPRTSSFRRNPSLLSGGGGLVCTARDYIRFCQMLLNRGELDGKRLLQADTVSAMTKNQLPKQAYPIDLGGKREGVGFGLGFSVVVEKTEFTATTQVGEYGWGGMASTHFWISPQDDLAVVVLTQLTPFSFQMEQAVKPLVYDAIVE